MPLTIILIFEHTPEVLAPFMKMSFAKELHIKKEKVEEEKGGEEKRKNKNQYQS